MSYLLNVSELENWKKLCRNEEVKWFITSNDLVGDFYMTCIKICFYTPGLYISWLALSFNS